VGDGLDVFKLNTNLTKVIERMNQKGITPDMSWMTGSRFETALHADPRFIKESKLKPSGANKLTAE